MNTQSNTSYELAVRDFQRARREAARQQFFARLRGSSDSLLNFEDVRQALTAGQSVNLGQQEVPLRNIVGSVGRHKDFTRNFLPLNDSDQERWSRVRAGVIDMKGFTPVDLYKVGDVYFVNDGNHRVSIAQLLNTKTITAHVSEIETRVPITPDDQIDEIIIKAGHADFLEKTNIEERYPDLDFTMTLPGYYPELLAQIKTECAALSGAEVEDCPPDRWDEAVDQWVQKVYRPVVGLVEELGVMERFRGRTETDIYVLVSDRRGELESALGWRLDWESAVPALLDSDHLNKKSRLNRLLDSVAPALEGGPEVGRWRRQMLQRHRDNHLFEKILMIFEGQDGDWEILEQVIAFSNKDEDHILGLYIVEDAAKLDDDQIKKMRHRFFERCQSAGLIGEFGVEIGRFDQVLIERASWVDMVVINVTEPPIPKLLARLRSTWGAIIQRNPRPILAIPNGVQSTHDRLLLAYDGSPKADEALYIAAYLTARWHHELVVLTVRTLSTSSEALEQANEYLRKHGIENAKYIVRDGPVHTAIIETAAEYDSNLLLIGGFGSRAAVRVFLGSTVEHLLREFEQPMLICS